MGDTLSPPGDQNELSSSPTEDLPISSLSPSSQYTQHLANSVLGADLAAQETGSKPFADRVSDIVTKGIPLTGLAVFNSFYNTAAEVGNFFGGDIQKATIEDQFGPDSDVTSYYQQHAGVIEGAALAAGSLLPGLGGVKALKLAQAGEMGNALRISTGLFSKIRTDAIAAASADLVGNATGESLFGLQQVNKIKAVLAGAAHQALQGSVYETATLATMHASPITDANTLADDINDVKDAAMSFGVVGGLIDGAGALMKIKKASRLADISTKAQEMFGTQGLGNITPGDRALLLYNTLDKIPNPSDLSRLGQMKLSATEQTTNRLIQEQMIKAADGDEEVAGAFRSFLEKGRAAGATGPQELQDNLSQLSSIGRHGDIDVTSVPSEVFYLPSKISPSDTSFIEPSQLMSRIATGEAEASKAFQLRSPTSLPSIGREGEVGTLQPLVAGATPTLYPKYTSPSDAFKKGVDIYLDGKGAVHINPSSTVFKEVPRPGQSRILTPAERKVYQATGNLPADSKPLNSSPVILDVTNGKLYGEPPLPVVGDIAKPKLSPDNKSLRVGDNLFPQAMGKEFSPTSPLDANARYVWASLRGVKTGDSIHPTDLPMMEQAYRELAAGNNSIEGNGITSFSDGSPIPTTADGMLRKIIDTKQGMYHDLLAAGKNADEIGHILNSPQVGLTKNFNTFNPNEVIIDPKLSENIRHIRLAYDIGTTKDSEGNLLRGMIATNYRVKLAQDAGVTAVANYLAKTIGTGDPSGRLAGQYFSALKTATGSDSADILGAGSSFFTNANADYGTFAQQTERIGRSVSELITKRHSVVSDTLSSAANKIRTDPAASAEWGNFVAVRHSTGENYILLSDADAQVNKLSKNTAVLEGSVTKDLKTGITTVNPNYLPPGFVHGSNLTDKGLKSYYTLSDKVVEMEKASQSLNAQRIGLRSDWWKAQGLAKDSFNPDILYAPPINTSKYPFMAYVRHREGYALGESGASVITASSAEQLQQKISLLGPQFDAFTKGDIAGFKKAQGEFDFDRNFMSNRVKSELARKGILNNVVPETRAENLINHLAEWHYRQEDQLLRDHVELQNAATFSQLRAMGDRFDQTGTSRFGAITPFTQRTATNPFTSYIRTALGVSPKDNYPIWSLTNEKIDSFASSAFNAVRDAFGATRKGLLPVEQAAKVSERFGLGNPYGSTLEEMSKSYYGGLANQLPDPNVFRKFVATANTTLGATIIRLDSFQQMIHAVTLPIMSAMEHASATKDLQELMTVQVPGTSIRAPGFMRTFYNAIGNFFGKDSDKLQELYSTAAGLTRDELQTYRTMIDHLSMPYGSLSSSGWTEKMEKAAQAGEKLTGTKFTNRFLHFVASDIGRQISEAQGISGQQLLDNIGTFTSRVLGNQAAGQRAGIFSGPIGQAVGLFQSYQWNLMQQLLRHVGEGDVKALAMGAGLQSSIFGLSSLPGFHALNGLIQQRYRNTQGADLYSSANDLVGHQAADYLLYGSLSGLLGISLYSRGDLNPRQTTILPVNPLNFPSVSAGIRVYQMLDQLQSNVKRGGDIPASLLLAAEHNGLSRPLSGLAELAQGFATSSTGQLISKTSGLQDLDSISNMSRIFGARPLEEGVALDNLYRSNALKALDNSRLETLGSAARTALYNNAPLAPQDFQNFLSQYVSSGGNQGNFNKWVLQQSKDANVSTVNRVFENFHSPRSKSLQLTMGGVPLPDFRPPVGMTTAAAVTTPSDPNQGLVQAPSP